MIAEDTRVTLQGDALREAMAGDILWLEGLNYLFWKDCAFAFKPEWAMTSWQLRLETILGPAVLCSS